jgi:hypothetical protein
VVVRRHLARESRGSFDAVRGQPQRGIPCAAQHAQQGHIRVLAHMGGADRACSHCSWCFARKVPSTQHPPSACAPRSTPSVDISVTCLDMHCAMQVNISSLFITVFFLSPSLLLHGRFEILQTVTPCTTLPELVSHLHTAQASWRMPLTAHIDTITEKAAGPQIPTAARRRVQERVGSDKPRCSTERSAGRHPSPPPVPPLPTARDDVLTTQQAHPCGVGGQQDRSGPTNGSAGDVKIEYRDSQHRHEDAT